MKRTSLCLIIGLGLTLAACQATVKTPPIEVELPGGGEVTIEPDSRESQDKNRNFCPPGQRKKGNC